MTSKSDEKNKKNTKTKKATIKVHSCSCDNDHEECDHDCDCEHDHEQCGCGCDHCHESQFINPDTLPSEEEILEINDILNKKYNSVLLDGKEFKVSYVYEFNILTVTVLLSNPDQSFYYPVQARVQPQKQDLALIEAFYFLLDYIDLYFEEYLYEDENLFIPIDWTNFEYDAVSFQLKGQILNLKLENEADILIKEKEKEEKKNKKDKNKDKDK